MAAVEASSVRSKNLYKVTLLSLKIIPVLLALCNVIHTGLCLAGIDYLADILSIFGGCSIFTLVFLYLTSYVFRFCLYHRLPLHYITVNLILNVIDEYIGIPLSNRSLYAVYLIITFIFIMLLVYEHCRKRNIKIFKRTGR